MQKESEKVLQQLIEGNARFASDKLVHPHQDKNRRVAVSSGQHPIAVVIGCSDSRVCPEIVFDVGLGDLFVIRTAGNISDDVVEGSIAYAVEHLDVSLVMVLGHQDCGVITTAATGEIPQGPVGEIVKAVLPAVEMAEGIPGDKIENIVKANACLVAASLEESLGDLFEKSNEDVKIVSAYYSFDTGKVEII